MVDSEMSVRREATKVALLVAHVLGNAAQTSLQRSLNQSSHYGSSRKLYLVLPLWYVLALIASDQK